MIEFIAFFFLFTLVLGLLIAPIIHAWDKIKQAKLYIIMPLSIIIPIIFNLYELAYVIFLIDYIILCAIALFD